MPESVFKFPIEPVGGLEGHAYIMRGIPAPVVAHSHLPLSLGAAMCMPTQWRWFHKFYAMTQGFFWIPCPMCGQKFGGHEVSTTISWPQDGPDRGRMICTDCTIAAQPFAITTLEEK